VGGTNAGQRRRRRPWRNPARDREPDPVRPSYPPPPPPRCPPRAGSALTTTDPTVVRSRRRHQSSA
jgi:hypothetical protein